jgi:hypothetical protein
MGQVMAVVSIILALAIAWPCLVIWFAMAFPGPVKRSRERLERSPWVAFFVGALVFSTVGFIGIAIISAAPGPVKVLGWVVLSPLFVASTVGGAGLVQLIGDRVRDQSAPVSPMAGLVRGAVITECAGIFPIIGWFFFAPIATIISLGAGTIGLFSGQRREVAAVPAYPHAAAPAYSAPPAYAPPAVPQYAPPLVEGQRPAEAPAVYATPAAPVFAADTPPAPAPEATNSVRP